MQIQYSTEGPDVSSGSPPSKGSIRVVIAYSDIVAGTRATGVISRLASRLGNKIEFHPIPSAFNLLDDVDWRTVAASDAIKADILILAVNGGGTMPSSVKRWTKEVIRHKHGTTAAVVALFDTVENADRETIKEWVSEAGLTYFAPLTHVELHESVSHLDERAETITPVLEHILEEHQASPDSSGHPR
jgi:hypothetical protein